MGEGGFPGVVLTVPVNGGIDLPGRKNYESLGAATPATSATNTGDVADVAGVATLRALQKQLLVFTPVFSD